LAFIKGIALSLWNNHRKKLITVLMGLAFAGLAALSGIPLEEIKSAAQDASKPTAVQVLPAQGPSAPEVK